MEYQKVIDAKKYLCRFDQILSQMANKMLCIDIINNITIDFIQCMIPHHQAAIYMCENLLEYTNYKPLQEIAKNIINTQTNGIEQMKYIKRNAQCFLNCERDVNCYITKYLSITKNMISKMKNSPRCIDINLSFVNEMIPHHEGAIAMCENLLKYCIDPRLKNVAESIINEQSQGVRELKEIQRDLCKLKK